jgi:hypothetical protein
VKGRHIGYHRLGRPDQVFDLVHCDIARPELNRLWDAIRANRRLLPPSADRVILRVDRAGGLHVIVQVLGTRVWTGPGSWGGHSGRRGWPWWFWWQPEGGRRAGGRRGPPEAYPAMVFEQIHPEMGDRVRAAAVGALGALSGDARLGPLRRDR